MIGGMTAAISEPAIAGQRRRHHHPHNRGAQVLRYQNVVNGLGGGLCLALAMADAVGPNDSLLRGGND